MKKLRKWMSRNLNSVWNCIVFGTACTALSIDIIIAAMSLIGLDDLWGGLLVYASINLFFIALFIAVRIFIAPHRNDSDIIDDNFSGISKKSRIFKKSSDQLLNGEPSQALNGFKTIEENFSESLSMSESALLCFYIARCYDVMGFLPNAVRYYGLSEEKGFDKDLMKVLFARALGKMNDISEALERYNDILEKDNVYSPYIRTDIGNMYLNVNDAESALKWFNEAIEKHENYASALAGAAVAHTMLHEFDKGEEMCRLALVHNVDSPDDFMSYFKRIQAAVLMESHTAEAKRSFEKERIGALNSK